MSETFFYFAYGSNMCSPRLKARTPSARVIGAASLQGHGLRFHKRGRDGSGKCDAFATGKTTDELIGVLFQISTSERALLDRAEGLNKGYSDATVAVATPDGRSRDALIYLAMVTHIDPTLRPFSWYKDFVLSGAREHGLPANYIDTHIAPVAAIADPDRTRDSQSRAILGGTLSRSD